MARKKFRTIRGYIGRRRKRIAKAKEEVLGVIEPGSAGNKSVGLSASARKLSFFGVNIDENVEQIDLSSAKPEDCYIIAQKSAMTELISTLLCPDCKQPGLSFEIDKGKVSGFSAKAAIMCKICESPAKENYLCERVGGSKSPNEPFDINIRATLAFRGIGCGYSAMRDWASVMDMPYSISRDSHTRAHHKIEEASKATFNEMVKQSRDAIGQAYDEIGVYPDGNGILNIGVSFDGSWQKRGYSSHNGMGSVIDLLTGLPIDYEVLSNFCFKCKAAEEKEIDPVWKQKHSDNCPKNFDGSAGAMEVACAERLWSRSVEHHKLRYTAMLCDGDSKAFDAVTKLAVYGADAKIEKEDCVNHVSKRMGAALRNLVTISKAQKESIAGKGKLTQEKITKIQNYYGRAIKDHANDITVLKKRIMAILFHMSSTDKTPKHTHCPPGGQSWCFWQRAVAKSENPGTHKEHETFTPEIGKKLVPIFLRLSSEDLLKRCVRNKTQNPNESMHNLIWRLCPKTIFVGRRTLETAVCLAVCQFSMGATFKVALCKALKLDPGKNLESSASKIDAERVKRAETACQEATKKRRKNLKYKKQSKEQKKKSQEGESYVAGGFNC